MKSFFPSALVLSLAAWPGLALAQPAAPISARPKAPLFSVAELEQFLGGRTLVSLDLKDATLEQVAAALSQASGQKIEMRPIAAPRTAPRVVADAAPVAAPLFNRSTSKTPLWEALRDWQLGAREANETAAEAAANTTTETAPPLRSAPEIVANSLGLTKSATGWWLQNDTSLADGRAVAAWPFLVIATDLKRNQDASLTQTGLRDTSRAAKVGAPTTATTGSVSPKPIAKVSTPDERWSDRLTLSGQVLIDPKLNPAALRYEVTEAKDDKGNDLHYAGEFGLIKSIPPRYSSDDSRSIASGASLKIPLRSKSGMGKRLVKLRGVIRFNVVTRSQHWETTAFDKPNGGTIFQDGGDFGVTFKALKESSAHNYWTVDFEATSRGAHLEQMWKSRPADIPVFNPWRGDDFASTRRENSAWTMDFSLAARNSNAGGSSWGSLLSFEGVAPVTLVDENGVAFEIFHSFHLTSARREVAGQPTITASDLSPLPPEDVAQNWSYKEERNLGFDAPYNFAIGADVKMGRPVKLSLDLPLERREVEIPFEFTDLPLPPS